MDTEIHKILKRFEQDNFVIISDGRLATRLANKPKIKKMRTNETLIIGHDRRNKQTIFFKKPKI